MLVSTTMTTLMYETESIVSRCHASAKRSRVSSIDTGIDVTAPPSPSMSRKLNAAAANMQAQTIGQRRRPDRFQEERRQDHQSRDLRDQ